MGGATSTGDPVIASVADAARRFVGGFGRADSPLTGVAAARDLAAAAGEALQAAVDRGRAAGLSWRQIGDALGTTRQAAFQRFGRPVDPRTGLPMSRDVAPGAAERAVAVFSLQAEARWDEVVAQLADSIRDRLDAGRLADGWAHVAGLFGRLERLGEPFAHRAGDDTVVDVPLHFEAGNARGIVRFGPDGSIAGLAVRPAPDNDSQEPT